MVKEVVEPPLYEVVSLCLACSKHPEVRKLVKSSLVHGMCGVCGSDKEHVYSPNDFSKLRGLIRALIRFYFDENAYNRHWGGTSVYNILLEEDNLIICKATSDEYVDIFMEQLETDGEVYPKYDEGICLYAGHHNEMRMLQSSIQNTKCDWLYKVIERLQFENYHALEEEFEGFIDRVETDLSLEISQNSLWFRSRIGVEKKSVLFGDHEVVYTAKPYTSSDIGALPPPLATSGRTNRQGVSVLYLAENIGTSIAEVRPHPNHLVSVGGFRASKNLRIAVFDPPISNFSTSDERLDLYTTIYNLSTILSYPIIPEERQKYAITQLLSDILIRRGFDGLRFHSSVGNGSNLCAFNPSHFKYDETQSFAKKIDGLEYCYSDILTSSPDPTMIEKEIY